MIDNFVILITCGAVVLVAFRAALLERRARRSAAAFGGRRQHQNMRR